MNSSRATAPAASETTLALEWVEHGASQHAYWRPSLHGPAPKRVQAVDDTFKADEAYQLISQGTALLWRGDFHNARQLLKALSTRVERRQKRKREETAASPAERFHQHRLRLSQRAQILNRLLIPLAADLSIPLRRAPGAADACRAAFMPLNAPELIPLRALQGYIGAWEWQKKGVAVPGLAAPIHVPHGVYSPIRGEYLPLLMQAPLPARTQRAFDIGTGSGVIAALLLQRGVPQVVGTDLNPRALSAAHDNLARLGLSERAELLACDLFPEGKADLIVCNPPWLPAKPTSLIEQAVYDPGHRMLTGFLQGTAAHLQAEGEAWLIMSDLAEHLGLRETDWLRQSIADAGLRVVEKLDTKPVHNKAQDADDPLFEARSKETTSLWRLAPATA